MKSAISKCLSFGMLGAFCLVLMLPLSALADSVAPETFSDSIQKAEQTYVRRIVTITEDVTSAKVDVFFLFDTTASMGDLIASAQASATSILTSASNLGDVAFGVGYYEDFPVEGYGYPNDRPYQLIRDITTDSIAVRNAINSLSLGSGNDWLESNLYALSQAAATTSWREDSTRIIVLFGDALGHDGDLEPNYPSDVGLDDAIAALNAKSIILEAVNVNRVFYHGRYYSLDEGYSAFAGQATAIANATGGKVFDGTNTSTIVTIINNALKDAFAEYSEVRLELSKTFPGLGVDISPSKITGNFDRSRERTFAFDITYTGTETGIYEFDLIAKVNGGSVAVASDTIEVVHQDCNGTPNGTAVVDNCGQCVGGNTGKAACTLDCNGDWGGMAVVDNCGQCAGGSTGETACVQDCNNDWGGTAALDNCGQCAGGNTGNTACEQDCNNDWGGTAVVDNCGQCAGGNTGNTACTQDCNGDWGGTASLDDCGKCVGGNTGAFACNPHFTGGVFTADAGGLVEIDWLYDGGMYTGEMGIFRLEGMEDFTPGSAAFVKEAATRALSNGEDGYMVISDASEGARFDGSLGTEAADWNSGPYDGIKQLPMNPGDTFATILVPNGTLQALCDNPGTTNSYIRPLFSLIASNPAYGMYVGQIADVNGMGRAFAYEDMDASGSDLDYNDLVIQITGATIDSVPLMDDIGTKKSRSKRDGRFDWRTDTELGRLIMEHVETEPKAVQMSVTLDASADLLLYDSHSRMMGRDGGHIPGAVFGYDADGACFIRLPGLPEGDCRVVIRGAEDDTGVLKVSVTGGQSIVSEKTAPVEIQAHRSVCSDLAVSSETAMSIGEIKASSAGPYDFNGNGKMDDADVAKVSSKWNLCEGNDEYDAFFDFDGDGCITILDIMQVVNGVN